MAIVCSDSHPSNSSSEADFDNKSQQSLRVKKALLEDIITQNETKPAKLPNNGESKLLLFLLATEPKSQ